MSLYTVICLMAVFCTLSSTKAFPEGNIDAGISNGMLIESPSLQDRSGKVKCKRRVCYFTNWAQHRQGDARQFPTDIDPSLCTHLIYAFARLNGNHITSTEWNDDNGIWQLGNYVKAVGLKKRNPNLKVLLAVGGWNIASPPILTNPKERNTGSRAEVVKNTIKYLRDRDFDGMEVDWEYPLIGENVHEDKASFSELLRELRAGFAAEAVKTKKPRLLLVAAVSAHKSLIDRTFDIPVLNSELDFINLMSYDMHGSWENHTGHNSPLYKGSWETGVDAFLNVDWAAKYWVQKGASKDKLVIGVPFFGRSFKLKNPFDSGVGASTSGKGNPGKYTEEKGLMAYYEICRMLATGEAKHYTIKDQKVPYMVYGDQWIGYDDAQSMKEKVSFIRDNDYGGVMMWDVSLDDIRGTFCGQGPYPLMHAIRDQCNA